jgi:FG-GAP repeat
MRHHHLSSLVPTLAMLCALGACIESTSYTPEPPSIPAPRLPMNNAYVGSVHTGPLRPLFRWEPATSKASGMISYQLQLSPDSKFETDVTSIETAETSYQPEADLPVSLAPPVGARYFWRLRSCLRGACSEYSRPWYVNLGRVIKDYNGDGYSDLAVGIPGSDAVYLNGGRVQIYLGGSGAGFDATPDRYLGTLREILNPEMNFGETLANAGDVNGDGFADLLAGTTAVKVNTAGRVFLYLGSSALDTMQDAMFRSETLLDGWGYGASALGDLNADGFDDIAILLQNETHNSANVYMGAKSGLLDTRVDSSISWPERYNVVRSAGDVNGDGAADVIVGSPEESTAGRDAGAAYIYFGAEGESLDTSPDATLLGFEAREFFGTSVASAGDLNGDGFADVAVGILRNEEIGDGRPGRAYVFFGKRGDFGSVPSNSLVGSSGNDSFGIELDSAGDVNADGFDDLLIGGNKNNLYFGGSGTVLDEQADASESGASGRSAGDLNGDGVADLIGEVGVIQGVRRIQIYMGNGSGTIDFIPDAVLEVPTGEGLGSPMAAPVRRRSGGIAR